MATTGAGGGALTAMSAANAGVALSAAMPIAAAQKFFIPMSLAMVFLSQNGHVQASVHIFGDAPARLIEEGLSPRTRMATLTRGICARRRAYVSSGAVSACSGPSPSQTWRSDARISRFGEWGLMV